MRRRDGANISLKQAPVYVVLHDASFYLQCLLPYIDFPGMLSQDYVLKSDVYTTVSCIVVSREVAFCTGLLHSGFYRIP